MYNVYKNDKLIEQEKKRIEKELHDTKLKKFYDSKKAFNFRKKQSSQRKLRKADFECNF